LSDDERVRHRDLADEPDGAIFAAGDGLGPYRGLLAMAEEKLRPNGAVVTSYTVARSWRSATQSRRCVPHFRLSPSDDHHQHIHPDAVGFHAPLRGGGGPAL